MVAERLKLWIVALVAGLMFATSAATFAQNKVEWTNGGPLLPDSSNFVTASMLVASPGEALYSHLGHAAIRLECPVHNLDYCFSFEEEPGMGGIFKFFLGKTDAHMIAIPTPQFVADFQKDGRELKQYVLNLTTPEEQELWRMLDNDFVDDEFRKFNFLQNNCSSVSFQTVEDALIGENIDFKGWPEPFKKVNGSLMKHYTRDWPWLQFLCVTFLGTESDVYWEQEQRVGPELLPQVLKQATIVDDAGNQRPVITGEKLLLPLVNRCQAVPITPLLMFGLLLAVTLLITWAQTKSKLSGFGRALDIVLLVGVTLVGILLIYTSFVSGIFGVQWNWYLIPFNPLPLVIWLIWRKRSGFYKVYLFYAVVLVLFILATPLSEQFDLPHQLITATLVVRCLYHYFEGKRQSIAVTKNKSTKKKHPTK